MQLGHNSDIKKNTINIFNVNNTIDNNLWNLTKLEISKIYNNNSNNIKVYLNKNNEITGTQNTANDIDIKFYDYSIDTNSVENVNFHNFVFENNILFYNIHFLNEYQNAKYETDFFYNVIETIKKNKNITLINNLLT